MKLIILFMVSARRALFLVALLALFVVMSTGLSATAQATHTEYLFPSQTRPATGTAVPPATLTPRLTRTPTSLPTSSYTPTRTPSATPTRTPSPTPSRTPSATPTRTPSPTPSRTPSATPTVTPNANSPVLVAAGDIVCGPNTPPNPCEYWTTSDTVLAIGPDVVTPLGDLQYENGLYQYFLDYYDPSWGRFKDITRPVPGNHEYYSSGGAHGYFDYFNGVGVPNGPAGERGKGYYSFDLGNWHIVAINSNCLAVGGCDVGSPQEVWLRQDLAASTKLCTLAYWHHARFSSGGHLSDPATADLWQALYDYDAEVVLSGHDHDYERFLPQDAQGNLDIEQGIVQFVVGTGGKNLSGVHHMQPNSAVFNHTTFGVLKLTLHSNSYQWEFVPSVGAFTESGSASCH